MDAGNGFAQPAWQAAYPALMAKARANGIALLPVRNSRHFAALWPLARDGLVALPVGTWAEPQRLAGRRPEGKRLQRFPINR